jgi:hypothetical protein
MRPYADVRGATGATTSRGARDARLQRSLAKAGEPWMPACKAVESHKHLQAPPRRRELPRTGREGNDDDECGYCLLRHE